jgi:hypothetical protein
LADGLLRNVDLRRGAGEASALRHGDEIADLSEIRFHRTNGTPDSPDINNDCLSDDKQELVVDDVRHR